MKRKNYECALDDCREPPYLGGLCKAHHQIRSERDELRQQAIRTLHRLTIFEGPVEEPSLREELLRINRWWDRACFSLIYRITDEVLGDEARYAQEWCISLAEEIIKAEKAFRAGLPAPATLEFERSLVWSRFANLEAGMMSNGAKRSPQLASSAPARKNRGSSQY
jgi:hypothetical protein